MKTKAYLYLACFIVAFTNISFAQNAVQWGFSVGSLTNTPDNSYDATTDASGNVIISGAFAGTVDFNPGAGTNTLVSAGFQDGYVAKYDVNGNFVWAISLGSPGNFDKVNAVATGTAGDIYVTGVKQGTMDIDPGPGSVVLGGGTDAFLVKYSASGNLLWGFTFNTNTVGSGAEVCTDNSDNVIVCGSFQGTSDFDPSASNFPLTAGATDGFVAKYSSSGNLIWAYKLGSSTGADYVWGVSTDASGNVNIAGEFTNTADLDPGVGTYSLTSPGTNFADGYVLQLNSSGAFNWAFRLGSTSTTLQEACMNITTDNANAITVTGFTQGIVDFDPGVGTATISAVGGEEGYVAHYSASGSYLWALRLGGSGNDRAKKVDDDALGNIYVTGEFANTMDLDPGTATVNITSAGSTDVYVSKYSSTGNFMGGFGFGSTGADYSGGMVAGSGNSFWISGYFQGTIDMEPGPNTFSLTSNGNHDFYVVKYNSITTSISEINSDKEIKLYPNPASDKIFISYNGSGRAESLQIHDLRGELIYQLNYLTNDKIEIPLHMQEGLYLITLFTNEGLRVQKKLCKVN